jgi:hypothetical protein
MPWQSPTTISFSRLEIVAGVPSDPGVFAIMDESSCLLVGETWNLKARLLDLANLVNGQTQLRITFECCADDAREARKAELLNELIPLGQDESSADSRILPGISLREHLRRSA